MAGYYLRTVRRHISVLQESVLVEGTVYENVAYGMGDADDGRVRQPLQDAKELGFVETLPAGWNTLVGERGARLSGAQRQLLSLGKGVCSGPEDAHP